MTLTARDKIKAAATRVNENKPAPHVITAKSDRGNSTVRDKNWKARKRDPNEALPPPPDLWERGFYDGAELRPFDGRPGAMDFKQYPSKGL